MLKNLALLLFAIVLVGGLTGLLQRSVAATGDRTFGEHLDGLDPDTVDWSAKDRAYWESVLSPQQVKVCRDAGTERPGSGIYNKNKEPGVFVCSSCGLPLFDASTKFESGTGWPSFTAPIAEGAVRETTDLAYGMVRTEITCGRCGAHLGHVFEDGPAPTGKRYCINSVCLLHRAEG